jgi:MFS transporter, DHA2 family, methylenomycin A resistance protein
VFGRQQSGTGEMPRRGAESGVAFGWRADWWALVPLALIAACTIVAYLPPPAHRRPTVLTRPVLNHVVLGSAFFAALTFAVMIGSFFIAEQYLQRAAGYSALGASTALVFVALLVGAVAPLAGRFADRHGERRPAAAGFLAAGLGLLALGVPGMPLRSLVTIAPLVPVGFGLGMLFVPVSRAALNAVPSASHGRVSSVLSVGRLLGAAAGSALAGLALVGGPSAPAVHGALLVACAACLLAGLPACALLPTPTGAGTDRERRDSGQRAGIADLSSASPPVP